MQKSDNPKYRDQRRNPKVIVPESFHKDGYANDFTIELEDAPLAHSVVQFCLRDAQYATLGEARRGMERGVKLRDYVQTHVFPKSAPPGQSAPPSLPPPVPDTSFAPRSRTPLEQRLTPTGQAQVANQFTAASALYDGFIPPSPSPRSGDKSKRGSSSQSSRSQPPTKFSKSDTTSYTSSSNSWRDNSSGRSAQLPLARNDRTVSKPPSIPKPPVPPEEESSSVTRPPPTPAATRGQGELRYPVPHFDGEYIELFTRDEAKDFYKTVKAKSLPDKGEFLSKKDPQRVLNKISEDISQHDKDMADFIMNRIDDASKHASDYVIEIMRVTTKRYVNIRGES